MRKVLFAGALCAAMTTGAQAATVEVLAGSVSVNAGEGFVPVNSGAVVGPGNTVMASPGSSGDIVYDNGCRVRVEEGSVAVVSAEPPTCAAGSSAGLGSNFGTLAVGALVVGGVAAAIAVVSSGDDKPASGQ